MDKLIVTIRDRKKRFNMYDIEIPFDVQISVLKKDIVETLNSYKKRLNLSDANVRLGSARLGRTLGDNETPESAGIWNGDYIDFDN